MAAGPGSRRSHHPAHGDRAHHARGRVDGVGSTCRDVGENVVEVEVELEIGGAGRRVGALREPLRDTPRANASRPSRLGRNVPTRCIGASASPSPILAAHTPVAIQRAKYTSCRSLRADPSPERASRQSARPARAGGTAATPRTPATPRCEIQEIGDLAARPTAGPLRPPRTGARLRRARGARLGPCSPSSKTRRGEGAARRPRRAREIDQRCLIRRSHSCSRRALGAVPGRPRRHNPRR